MSVDAFQRERGQTLSQLVGAASRVIDVPLAIDDGDPATARLGDAVFSLVCADATPADHARADAAAIAGQAAGMDRLARACPLVWRVTRVSGDDADELRLRAALAFALLGPILPDEEATLYGVRGARARLTSLSARAASSR